MSKTFKHLKEGDTVWKIAENNKEIIPLRVVKIVTEKYFINFKLIFPRDCFCYDLSERHSRPRNHFYLYISKSNADTSYEKITEIAINKRHLENLLKSKGGSF